MNNESHIAEMSFGAVIGQFHDCDIYQTVELNGAVYAYDRLALVLPDGRFAFEQLSAGEALVAPGLIYTKLVGGGFGCQGSSEAGQSSFVDGVPEKTVRSLFMREAIGQLIGFYSFHWWRIATLRPAFTLMSDRKENVFVFAALYWVLGLVRWLSLGDKPLSSAAFSLFFGMAGIFALTVRPKQSLSFAAALLASSAAVDLLALFSGLLGFTFPGDLPLVFAQTLMWIACARAFHHAPIETRQRGYKAFKKDL